MKRLLTSAAILAAIAATSAQATVIPSLYNTGETSGGASLPNDLSADPHYTVAANDGATAAGGPAVASNCCYFAAPSGSQWITVDASDGADAANTTYETTFDLTGFNLADVTIYGGFAADNHATIYLNGVDTGYHIDDFNALHSFTLSSGFNAGLNTLDFKVMNDGGPESLLVNFSGTGVPEPATWGLMTLGLFGLGGALRARARKAVLA